MTKRSNKYEPSWLIRVLTEKLSIFLANTITGYSRHEASVTFVNRLASFLTWSYLKINQKHWLMTDEEGTDKKHLNQLIIFQFITLSIIAHFLLQFLYHDHQYYVYIHY